MTGSRSIQFQPIPDYPKTLEDNAAFRVEVLAKCKEPGFAFWVKKRCRDDLLFWLNVFGWTHDPRKIDDGQDPIIPFVTWPFQDRALGVMEACFGKEDLCIVKSRCMGASWMVMALFTHRWQFHKNLALGVVSREERLVDGTPKGLFAKIDFLLKHQPDFLVPKYRRKELLFLNEDGGSTIEGASTTGNVFAGDRYTAAMMDELGRVPEPDGRKALAASQFATRSRFFNSTPLGSDGAFADVAHNPNIKRLDLWWYEHPEYCDGLVDNDKIKGGKWSPWFKRECDRLVVPALIAGELLLDFVGSASPFFPEEVLTAALAECRPPMWEGVVVYDGWDPKKAALVESQKGDLKLWMGLRPDGKVPAGEQFVVAADISAGTGATNSVLSIGNKRNREKVGEIARADLSPDRFAELAVAIATLFNGAYLIWENNGPGSTFGKRVIDLGYRNIYFRRDEQGLTKKVAPSLVPGWNSSKQNKLDVLREYIRCLSAGAFVNRSRDAVQECRQYVYFPNGQVGNMRASSFGDPSGARENHGDRVIADALCCKALGPEAELLERPPTDDDPFRVVGEPAPHSFAWLMQKDQRRSRETSWESSEQSLRGWQESPQTLQGW